MKVYLSLKPNEVFEELEKFVAKKMKKYNLPYTTEKEIKDTRLFFKIIITPPATEPFSKKEVVVNLRWKGTLFSSIDGNIYLNYEEGGEAKKEVGFNKKSETTSSINLPVIKTKLANVLAEVIAETSISEWAKETIQQNYYEILIKEKIDSFLETLSDAEKKTFLAFFKRDSFGYPFFSELAESFNTFIPSSAKKEEYYWFCSVLSNPEFKEGFQKISKVISENFALYKI